MELNDDGSMVGRTFSGPDYKVNTQGQKKVKKHTSNSMIE